MRLLITAFGPFPGVPKNPSEALARRIAADRRLKAAGIETAVRIFPTEYAAVTRDIPEILAEVRPACVLMLGVASRRRHLSVEKRGANRVSRLHPDASGARPPHLLLKPGAPAFRLARAPLGSIVVAAL
ncbi:MAG TPA: peptidase C15, partial [Beijerinckiaceae bacterium]|nr:peptidase C15 [Beijerinckiaceae bacterium]